MLSHNSLIPSDSRACLGFAGRQLVHLICRFMDERQHSREGDVVRFEKVGSNTVEPIHEVAAEDGCQVKVFPALAVHLLGFAPHTFGKQSEQLEVLFLTCLNVKWNLRGRNRAFLGERLEGIEHASPLRGKHIHRYTSSSMDHKSFDILKFLTDRTYRPITDSDDVEVGILRNGTRSLASSNTSQQERRLDVGLQEARHIARSNQYCPICTRSHFSRSSFCGLRSIPLCPTAIMQTARISAGMASRDFTMSSVG